MSDDSYSEDWRIPLCQSCGLRRAVRSLAPYLCAACKSGPVHPGWCDACAAERYVAEGACMTCGSTRTLRGVIAGGIWG
jgi:hypothetical protein